MAWDLQLGMIQEDSFCDEYKRLFYPMNWSNMRYNKSISQWWYSHIRKVPHVISKFLCTLIEQTNNKKIPRHNEACNIQIYLKIFAESAEKWKTKISIISNWIWILTSLFKPKNDTKTYRKKKIMVQMAA